MAKNKQYAKRYDTEEERQAARKASLAKSLAKHRRESVKLDADLLELLNSTAGKLEAELGFRPSISQTLRYMLQKHGRQTGGE